MFFLRTKMSIVDGVIMGALDTFFEHGKDIESLIAKTPLCFINLTSTELITYNGYLILAIKPVFNHEGCEHVDWYIASEILFDSTQSLLSDVFLNLVDDTSDIEIDIDSQETLN